MTPPLQHQAPKHHNYCRDLIIKHDRDRAALISGLRSQADLWPLFAFNHEIAKTREVVSETRLGLIRLQWWRDAITKLYQTPKETDTAPHEILTALRPVIRKYDLPLSLFEDMIYAREFDLEDVMPADMDGLKAYCALTLTPLHKLALRITGEQMAEDDIKAHSTAYGMIGILRAAPFFAMQNRCLLPSDLMSGYGIRIEDWATGKRAGKRARLVETVISDAAHLQDSVTKTSSAQSRFVRRMTCLGRTYADIITVQDYEVRTPRLATLPLRYSIPAFFRAI